MKSKQALLYTNNLKNREFGKEAPQNFCLERATVAERQGASENKNSEVKLTLPKTDFSGYLCITVATIFLLMNEAQATSLTVNVAGDTASTTGGTFSGSSGDLRGVLNNINLNPGTYQVTFSLGSPTITPAAPLPVINLNATNTVTIDGTNGGNPIVLDCSSTPGFFARQGTVTLQNMTIENGHATGGSGGTAGYGGGGGLGAGGALFIDQANVTLSNLILTSNTATGGSGGALVSGPTCGGGGGGMGGSGGSNSSNGGGGGGGGLVGAGGASVNLGSGGGGGGIGAGGNGVSVGDSGGGGGGGGAIGCNGGSNAGNGTNITAFPGLGGGGGAGGTDGSGGTGGNGGGGGMGGTSSISNSSAGGGGGGNSGMAGNNPTTSVGAAGGTGGTGGGGGGGGGAIGGGGNGANAGANGAGGGGGEGGSSPGGSGGNGSYSGGGGGGGTLLGSGNGGNGGDGNFGGGGGGGGKPTSTGGSSSFGGGGGGGTTAGTSGFGAGGAGSSSSSSGGVGGGNSTNANGGGGAGLGGGVFVNNGGTLQVSGLLTTSSNATSSGAAGGSGAFAGAEVGTDLFAATGSTLIFSPGTGQIVTLAGTIADDSTTSLPAGHNYTPGSGAGANLTKNGSGELLLTGNQVHTYAGETIVNAGTLFLNGTLSSNVTVAGGTFTGNTPTVAANVTVDNGATLAGGSATSQMSITGMLTLNPTSTTSIEIDPTSASQITIEGLATFDGNVSVIVDPGSYPPTGSYDIIHYTTESGAYSPLILGGAPGFVFSLVDNHMGLIQLLYQLPPSPISISLAGLTGNDRTIAKYLNKSNLTSQAYLDLTQLSGHDLKKALNSISPTRNSYGSYAIQQTIFALSELTTSHFDEHRFFKSAQEEKPKLAMHLAHASLLLANASSNLCKNSCNPKPPPCPSQKNKYDFWVGAFGEASYQKAQHQSPAFNFITEGVLAAFDYYLNRGFVGAGLGYAHTHLHEDNRAGKASINYGIGTIYGGFDVSHFYMDVVFWGIYNRIDNERHISFPGFSATASAKINGWQFDPHFDLGYDIDYTWGCLEPFIASDWANSWQHGYHEHGADSLNMHQKTHHSSLLRTEAGFKLYEDWEYDWGVLLLKEKLSYVYKKPFGTGSVTAAVVGGAGFFTVESLTSVQNLGSVGFEFLTRIGKKNPVSFSMVYTGEFGKQYQSHEVLLSVTKDF